MCSVALQNYNIKIELQALKKRQCIDIMVSTKLFKGLLQRNRTNYRSSKKEYIANLSRSSEQDLEEKQAKLESRSIEVEIKKELQKDLCGIGVARSDLSGATENERILLVRLNDKAKQVSRGIILKIDTDVVRIKLDEPLKEGGEGEKFRLEFDNEDIVWRYSRIRSAIWRLKDLNYYSSIHKCLLGYYDDFENVKYSKARVFYLEDLNQPKEMQRVAIEQSLRKKVFIVEGNADSGRASVAAVIAHSMVRSRKAKVLLCSVKQETVNKLCQIISESRCVQVVQLPERRNEPLEIDNLSTLNSLDTLVANDVYEMSMRRSRKSGYLTRADRKYASRQVKICSSYLRQKLERKIIYEADVVCCTLIQADSPCLRGVHFDMLIVDDAHLAAELECIVPMMVKGLKQVTLLGEPHDRAENLREDRPNSSSTITKTHLRPGGLFNCWLPRGITSVALK